MPRYNLFEKQEAICLRRVCRTHVSQRGDYICTNSNGAGTSRAPNIQTSPAMHTDTSSRPRFFVNGSTVLPFHNTITITTTTTTLKVTIVPYSSGPYLTNHCELHVAAVSKTPAEYTACHTNHTTHPSAPLSTPYGKKHILPDGPLSEPFIHRSWLADQHVLPQIHPLHALWRTHSHAHAHVS